MISDSRGKVNFVARIDDYHNAFALALDELKDRNLHHVAGKSGAKILEEGDNFSLELPFIERLVRIDFPEGKFSDLNSEDEIPVQEKVLILHYLNKATGSRPNEDWIAYREVPDGSFYFAAFTGRAINPFKGTFGENAEILRELAPILEGKLIPEGDVGFIFTPFPHVPIKYLLWKGDDEFPPEANILFDRTVQEYLSAEDIAWLAGMIVYRLMGLSRKIGKKQ